MDERLLKLLRQADHPSACEAPPGFEWARAIERVRGLKQEVESITGRTFEIDENVQDASFFAELGTYTDERQLSGGIFRLGVLVLRFSAFGDLFTICSACPENEQLDPAIIQRVIPAAERSGFVFVDAEQIQSEYTGVNPHLAGTTWWIRFFDYL